MEGVVKPVRSKKKREIAENAHVLGVCLIGKRRGGNDVALCSGSVVRGLLDCCSEKIFVVTSENIAPKKDLADLRSGCKHLNTRDYFLYFKKCDSKNVKLSKYELSKIVSEKAVFTASTGLAFIPIDASKTTKRFGTARGISTYRPFPVDKIKDKDVTESLDNSVCQIVDGNTIDFAVKSYNLEHKNDEYVLKLPEKRITHKTWSELTANGACSNRHPYGAVILNSVTPPVAVGVLTFDEDGKIRPVLLSQFAGFAHTPNQPNEEKQTNAKTGKEPVTFAGNRISTPSSDETDGVQETSATKDNDIDNESEDRTDTSAHTPNQPNEEKQTNAKTGKGKEPVMFAGNRISTPSSDETDGLQETSATKDNDIGNESEDRTDTSDTRVYPTGPPRGPHSMPPVSGAPPFIPPHADPTMGPPPTGPPHSMPMHVPPGGPVPHVPSPFRPMGSDRPHLHEGPPPGIPPPGMPPMPGMGGPPPHGFPPEMGIPPDGRHPPFDPTAAPQHKAPPMKNAAPTTDVPQPRRKSRLPSENDHKCNENTKENGDAPKIKVTLASNAEGWDKMVNGQLEKELARNPRIKVTGFVPHNTNEQREHARELSIELFDAKSNLSGYTATELLSFPPEDLKIDILMMHSYGRDVGRQAHVIKEAKNCKWVLVAHTISEELEKYVGKLSEHKLQVTLCEKADLVVAVGPKVAEAYTAALGYCGKHVVTLIPGIPEKYLGVRDHLPCRDAGGKFRVLISGSSKYFKVKGCDIASQAITLLQDSSYYLILVVQPNDDTTQLEQAMHKEGISVNQLLVRECSGNTWHQCLCEADLLIKPSRTEGFGMSGLRAISADLPVLISGNTGLGIALKLLPSGGKHVVDSEDPQVWADKIKEVREKRSQTRRSESEELRNEYMEKFNWKEQCDELVNKMIEMFPSKQGISFE